MKIRPQKLDFLSEDTQFLYISKKLLNSLP